MIARTFSATMLGLQPIKVEVEVDTNRGTPGLHIIGLPTQTIDEAKERITAALLNCGIRIRSKRTIVNLAPADIRKTSSNLELAIAVGLLKIYGEDTSITDTTIFFGELSLDGSIKPIKGALPLVLAAHQLGFKRALIPAHNQREVQIVKEIEIIPLSHLSQYLAHVKRKAVLPTLSPEPYQAKKELTQLNFSSIAHQEGAKRALEIAAAGGHNVLMIGPPGSGKSALAQAMTSILPPLTQDEAIEVTTIHSIAGLTTNGLITTRPFRSPHHTISAAGLLGGGMQLKPGEISLAHRGVLFMDELPEFGRFCLEALRQPLEVGHINIVRAIGAVRFPTNFSLIAAANPCSCGYYGSAKKTCTCSPHHLELYQKRLSGPLLDRIDMHVRVPEVAISHLSTTANRVESSETIKKRVIAARTRQQRRFTNQSFYSNSEIPSAVIRRMCPLTAEAEKILITAADKLGLSARGYFKVIKVAQTIADLDTAVQIQGNHLAEALQYR